jgi:YVTN family beta-propeller protein
LLPTLLSLGTTMPAQILLVLQKHDDSLGWYDPQTGKPAGRVAKVGHIPHEFVLSRDEERAYVTNYGVDSYNTDKQGGNTLSVVDLQQHRTIREIDLGQYHRPHGIAIGQSGRLYVTCDLPPRVLVVDPSKGKVLHAADVKAKGPHMVVVSRDETHVWAADALSGTVTGIDLQHDGSVKQIEIGGVPMGMVLSGGGERLFATTHADKLAVIDTATDRLLRFIAIPGQPARVTWTPDHKYLLIATIGSGDVVVVDAQTEKVIRKFHAGRGAEGIVADPKGAFGYVSAQRDNNVVRFSLKTWEPSATISTGAMPDSLALINR